MQKTIGNLFVMSNFDWNFGGFHILCQLFSFIPQPIVLSQ